MSNVESLVCNVSTISLFVKFGLFIFRLYAEAEKVLEN